MNLYVLHPVNEIEIDNEDSLSWLNLDIITDRLLFCKWGDNNDHIELIFDVILTCYLLLCIGHPRCIHHNLWERHTATCYM